MKSRLLTGLCALLVATGCMSNDTIDDVDVNQDKLYGHYCVSYDANTHMLDFWVQLRAGGDTGTTVRLTEGHLSVDGHEMNEHYGDEAVFNLQGTYYYLKRTALERQESYAFNWDRSDGHRVTNHIALPERSTVISPVDGSTRPRGHLTVVFDGPAPGSQDTVEVVLRSRGVAGHGPVRKVKKRVTAGNEVTFSALEMLRFIPGSRVTVEVKKKTKTRPQRGHAAEGGLVETEYVSERVHFHLALL
jgi:hypothetical protein